MTVADTVNKMCNISEKTIGSKKYVVKSVFIGDKDIKSTILKLAERKAIKEMGIDISVA